MQHNKYGVVKFKDGVPMLWRLIKFLLLLAILGMIALVAYAYIGPVFFPADFAAPTTPVVQPITLDAN